MDRGAWWDACPWYLQNAGWNRVRAEHCLMPDALCGARHLEMIRHYLRSSYSIRLNSRWMTEGKEKGNSTREMRTGSTRSILALVTS